MTQTLLVEFQNIVRELIGMVAVALVPRADISDEMIAAAREAHASEGALISMPGTLPSAEGESRETFGFALRSLVQVLFEIDVTLKAVKYAVRPNNRPNFDRAVWVGVVQVVCEQICTVDDQPQDGAVSALVAVPEIWERHQQRCEYLIERVHHLHRQLTDSLEAASDAAASSSGV